MKREWWMQLFEGEGAGGAGGGGETPAPEGEKKPEGDGGGKPPEDVSGLKSALEKERQARKEAQQRLAELQPLAEKGKDAEELRKKIAEFEFRDQRDAALAKAVEEATKDGKHVVDLDKARKLAAKLVNPATLEADLTEVVDALKTPKVETKGAPVLKGQPVTPDTVTDDIPYSEWGRLQREDPEGYKRMIEKRRKGTLA